MRVTGEGAPVVLRVGPAPWPDQFVVEVRDGGPGLTADDLAVAFEPGELHARYTGIRKVGSGVGLALVARLAERLGGRAEAGVSREGGAAFRVILPDRSTAQTEVPDPSQGTAEPHDPPRADHHEPDQQHPVGDRRHRPARARSAQPTAAQASTASGSTTSDEEGVVVQSGDQVAVGEGGGGTGRAAERAVQAR